MGKTTLISPEKTAFEASKLRMTGALNGYADKSYNVSFCHNSARAKAWPRAADGQIFAGYAVMRAGPGAARSLFVAVTILVAAHVTLLVV